jgi:hypothetical protein
MKFVSRVLRVAALEFGRVIAASRVLRDTAP